MADRVKKLRTFVYFSKRIVGRRRGWLSRIMAALEKNVSPSPANAAVVAKTYTGPTSEQPEVSIARQSLSKPNLKTPPVEKWQPPAAPAVTEAASVHLARWAPHPSADTTPGTKTSPRMPAPETVPPKQKPVDEATSVRAAPSPVAVPSSLPVADSGCRRGGACAPGEKNLVDHYRGFLHGDGSEKWQWLENNTPETRDLFHEEG
jgi:hypothetical protein